MEGNSFKKPVNLSSLMSGVVFELNNDDSLNDSDEVFDLFWNCESSILDQYKNPCETSFTKLKLEMEEISEGVYKKNLQKAPENVGNIDLSRHRITYHRNLFVEHEDHPFDSTYLNAKTDVVWIGAEKVPTLQGILEAVESMKEGEQSLFIISYEKMFKKAGCPPRIPEQADILCDLKILKVESIGDPEMIERLARNDQGKMYFADIKQCIEETRITATDHFSRKNFDQAIKLYQRILQSAGIALKENENEEENCRQVIAKAHLNLAICFNLKKEPKEAMEHIKAFESFGSIDDQPKALYAKGRAFMMLSEFDEAQKCFKIALKLSPSNKQITEALEELKEHKIEYTAFLKNFSKNLKSV